MSEEDYIDALNEDELKEDSMKLTKVAGRDVLMARHDGQVYGVSNKCPHMGCSLANGKLDGYLVVCPCHSWAFDVRTGEYTKAKGFQLMTYECRIYDGKVQVKILDF